MASTVRPTATTQEPAAEQESALLAWFEKNKKLVSYVAIAIAVVAIGAWLFVETGRRKQLAASDALDRARGAFESGNLSTASAEFQRVAQNFSGTAAGFEAELALNQVRLASGQTQIAADELKKFADRNPPPGFAAGAWGLRGGALENLKQWDEAAQSYAKAAELAPEDYRKVDYLLDQARVTRLAGNQPQAIEVLRGVVSKFGKDVPGVAEAQVRLAEWTRGAM